MERQTIIIQIKRAILRGDTLYDGIVLPSPQRAGTYYQQSSYASQQAETLYDIHFGNLSNLKNHDV